jgi:uncharacterized protein
MVVGVLRIELLIPGVESLKEKRMVLRSLKDRLKNNFNISVSEVGMQDKWQRAVLGAAGVSGDKAYLNGQLDKVIDYIERFNGIEMVHYEMEFC